MPDLPGGKTSAIYHYLGTRWEENILLSLSALPRCVSKEPQLLPWAFTKHRSGAARWENSITQEHL